MCVGLRCRTKANGQHVGRSAAGGVSTIGVFLRDTSPYLRELSPSLSETPKKSEWLGRHARPRIEPSPPIYQF